MILFLDLEVDIATQKVKEIGLVQGERYYKGRDQSKIREFAQGAKWICGHNLLGHDLPMLKRMGLADRLNRLEPIDTLLLSPLLRPDLKRHKLAKDYLVNDLSKADPLYDAELARDLLYDLGDLWQGLPHNIREGFRSILGQQVGFRGFFEWLSWEKGAVPSTVQEPLALSWLRRGSRNPRCMPRCGKPRKSIRKPYSCQRRQLRSRRLTPVRKPSHRLLPMGDGFVG
jgi:hypothetical protein